MKPKVYLTRVYNFSSAHRLYSKALSEEENWEVYGKCSNPKGHGHNYVLEITVCGFPDSKTGMVINVQKLDQIVHERILACWDHRHLDEEAADFQGTSSTGENIVQIVWEKLKSGLPDGRLHRVKLSETSTSSFEYYGNQE